jgi:uncharacterized iron-regulated membrane protein
MKGRLRWKRLNYLVHRWIGIVLGIQVLAWFVSGIAMMYYPYPEVTESKQLALLDAFEPADDLIGFRAAYEASLADLKKRRQPTMQVLEFNAVGARLMRWDGRLAYELWHDGGSEPNALAVVDGRTGEVLTPISPDTAARVARVAVSPLWRLDRVELLPRGDNYMMFGGEHSEGFPVYRVRFADDSATAVYVGMETGHIYEVVDRVTRFTTWVGFVPHYLYFMWLYQHYTLWTWLNYIFPAMATVAALAGIILGAYQLFPRRRRGDWSATAYQGISKWHHVAGVVFGVMVLSWALSGLFEMLGGDAAAPNPRNGQAERVQAGPVRWSDIRVSEAAALKRLRAWAQRPVLPLAIDLDQLEDRPGYHVRVKDGPGYWVDAIDGTPRSELELDAAKSAAQRVVGAGPAVTDVDRITAYDSYYYARHGREMHLPAWRVAFDDPSGSVVYLDTVSGRPVGFVDGDTRLWRWLRRGMHSLDIPGVVNRRPYWDFLILPLVVGGMLCAGTGVWLLGRRLRRMTRAHEAGSKATA